MGTTDFGPPQIPPPWTHRQKIFMSDFAGVGYTETKFSANPSTAGGTLGE